MFDRRWSLDTAYVCFYVLSCIIYEFRNKTIIRLSETRRPPWPVPRVALPSCALDPSCISYALHLHATVRAVRRCLIGPASSVGRVHTAVGHVARA